MTRVGGDAATGCVIGGLHSRGGYGSFDYVVCVGREEASSESRTSKLRTTERL
jgi:hypothetical protein